MPVLGSISNMADVWLRAGARMERMTEKQVAKKTIEKLAIVVVTYKRQQLLATLFESIEKLTVAPWRIIVVDNEHSDKTHGMVEEFSAKLTAQWGTTVADLSGNENRVVYAPQTDNLGGAGGFSAGVRRRTSWVPNGSGSWTTTSPSCRKASSAWPSGPIGTT